jgi:allantoicase
MNFTSLPDLASRALAGSVVHANDELFAERENLIKPGPAAAREEFGPKGKVYDGWETRRRREPGHDHAIVRLGVPGIVHGVVIDTAWFTGNYPPEASVEATGVEGYPSPDELAEADWVTLLPRSPLEGDTENAFPVGDPQRFTHVRLSIYPDGGVARFRVHGEPLPDPRLLTGTVDLAAVEHGGSVVDCSNRFYASPMNLLLPGRATSMGEGWENARRRDAGNDHVTVRLAAPGLVRRVELDTSYFVGNAPGWARLQGAGPAGPAGPADPAEGPVGGAVELVPRTRLQPDTRHVFRVPPSGPVDQVRLDVYPDGGLARLRVFGEVDPPALAELAERFLECLPEQQLHHVLSAAGLPAQLPLPPEALAALLGS